MMKVSKVWFIALAVYAAIGSGAVVMLAVSLSSAKGDAQAAEERAEDAEDEARDVSAELEEMSDDLDDTEAKLARTRKDLQEATSQPEPEINLTTALDNGSAIPDPDLSASSPAPHFTCENRSCSALSMEYVFKNESQDGSAVTCIFEVEYENGGTTTFRWASEFVPPGGGTDTVRVYFSGARPIGFISDPDDCYRGWGV